MMNRIRRLQNAVLLTVIAAGAWLVRAWLPAGRVFGDGHVTFQGDASYHMRVVDHLVANFPHRLTVDPYAAPDGQYVAVAPLFDYLVATLALIAGGGSPSATVVERVGALVPAALGTLAIVVVYLIGVRLFDARAGLTGAALLAVMPGPFLDRTLAGEADHHAAEVVLVLLTLLSVTAAEQRAGRDPGRSPWRHSAAWLAGVALGAYCLTWTSAALFIGALGLWSGLQMLIDARLGRSTAPVAALAMIMGTTALGIVLAFQDPRMFRFGSQVAALGALVLLGGTARVAELLLRRFERPGLVLVAVTAAAAGSAAAVAALFFPAVAAGLLQDVLRLEPNVAGRLVEETQPLMRMLGRFSWVHPWNVFGPIFFVGVPALAALAVKVRHGGTREHSLLLAWSVVALAATLGQNRFGYYLAPLLALLAGWICSALWTWQAKWPGKLAAVTLAALIFLPSLRMGVARATYDQGWSAAWHRAMLWMRDHTPEPFGDPTFYLAPYDDAAASRAAYSVMSWADDGYEVLRVARRVPVANPTHADISDAARFFTSTSEADALEMLAEARSRYVVASRELVFMPTDSPATLLGKFESLSFVAGLPQSRFAEGMLERGADGQLTPAWVFHPDYYRSMAVRLFVYGASAVEPENSTWVITYADRRPPTGRPFREIVNSRRFARYSDAEAALTALGSGPHLIVGRHPLRTAVPLKPLDAFRPIHDERDPETRLTIVRIFEVVGPSATPLPSATR